MSPPVFCTMDLASEAMSTFGPITRKGESFSRFANTLIAHASGIFEYYNFRISTGPLEGTNNKIKVMKRKLRIRDMEFFKLKIMAIHHSKYALVG